MSIKSFQAVISHTDASIHFLFHCLELLTQYIVQLLAYRDTLLAQQIAAYNRHNSTDDDILYFLLVMWWGIF